MTPFSAALRHKMRARMCPAYVAGLIDLGDRKSIQPMAARNSGVSYHQLQHFIGSSVWDAAQLEATLLAEADKLVGGDSAWLIIDDTALPKKGCYSVGVAPQYSSALGKTANFQSLVSVTLASREVPVMVGLIELILQVLNPHQNRAVARKICNFPSTSRPTQAQLDARRTRPGNRFQRPSPNQMISSLHHGRCGHSCYGGSVCVRTSPTSG